jgi:hypothetical protein
MRHISIVKERYETLQIEKEKVQSETAAKDQEIHFQLLKKKALLEK